MKITVIFIKLANILCKCHISYINYVVEMKKWPSCRFTVRSVRTCTYVYQLYVVIIFIFVTYRVLFCYYWHSIIQFYLPTTKFHFACSTALQCKNKIKKLKVSLKIKVFNGNSFLIFFMVELNLQIVYNKMVYMRGMWKVNTLPDLLFLFCEKFWIWKVLCFKWWD